MQKSKVLHQAKGAWRPVSFRPSAAALAERSGDGG